MPVSSTVSTSLAAPLWYGELRFREAPREGFVECWLSAALTDREPSLGEAARMLTEVARTLAERGVVPLQEKLYGPRRLRAELLAARGAAFTAAGLDADAPCLCLSGRADGPSFLGVQVWGVIPVPGAGVTVETFATDAGARGRELRGPGFRLVHFQGLSSGGTRSADPAAQLTGAFESAEQALAARGLGFLDVARTWLYLDQLLDDYALLNRVRTDFYGARGLGAPEGRPYPASTGIQGSTAGEALVLEVLAATGLEVAPVLQTRRQGAAAAYGSSFSRGSVLGYAGGRVLHISGTASIGTDGLTRHLGDREAQILETLLAVGALVEEAGGVLGELALATAFVKDLETLAAFHRICRALALPPLPVVPMLADVCRPELLFELEAVLPLPTRRLATTPPSPPAGKGP